MTHKNNTKLFEKLLVIFCQEEDPMKEMLQWITNQLMEIEVNSLKTQAKKGQHSEERKTYRNGYRVRRWDTRLGTIYLTTPKVRMGGYQPFFLVNRQRSEVALMSVIQECWINCISTRKMRRVFQSFGIEDISAGQVSNITKDLDKEVNRFRSEPISDDLEDALQFFHFDELSYGRTSSINHLERLNLEIRRRSNVVGISPSTDSFLWLIGSYLLEYQADWATSKAYIRPDKLDLFYVNNLERKVA
jgi:transposase-like protein